MLIPNHPHDERLAALASADADATDDSELTSHVASCARCTETVAELGALRASLAELPDLRPARPLRLLPGVEPGAEVPAAPADRLTGWVRRVFAPVMTVGATLALVGLVGTTVPALSGGADGGIFQNVGAELNAGGGAPAPEGPAGEEAAASQELAPLATTDSGEYAAEDGDGVAQLQSAGADERLDADDSEALTGLPAERPIWPMLLFSGVALVIVALLLRWIVVPRAG